MKSHVSMGMRQCLVCLKKYEDSVLLDRRLKDSMEKETFVGQGLCPEHEKLHEEGYLALVEVEEPNVVSGDRLDPSDAIYTGNVCHIRYTVAKDIFKEDMSNTPVAYIDAEAFNVFKFIESQHQGEVH